jgi:hypothetical protein
VRIPRFFRISFILVALFLLNYSNAYGQISRIGAGFAFASPVDFNYGETGNPGIVLKTWVILNKAHTLQLTPSLTAFNRYRMETGYSILTNYMFHGDLDMQYTVFQEGNVKLAPFVGGNVTYLTSDFEPIVETGNETITDTTDLAPGGNLGAALELRMSPNWDFFISGKYTFSKYSQFVISVQGVYYFKSRRRAYRR